MNNNKPLYWHEGLFLRPQHLQQQDLINRNYAVDFQRLNSPYIWGVLSLVINQAALADQLLEIESCEIFFQDGTFIKSGINAVLQRRKLSGNWDKSGKPMSVYLGIRKIQPGKNNIDTNFNDTISTDAINLKNPVNYQPVSRYILADKPTSTYDLFDEDKKDDIHFLEHNVLLFIDDEATEAIDYHTIKIADLVCSGSEILISNQYIPPVLDLRASTILYDMLQDIKDKITSRANELSLYKQNKGLYNSELITGDFIFYFILLTLNRYIPQITYLCETRNTMPWACYTLLRQLAGELSTFSSQYNYFGGRKGEVEDSLPEYDHNNLFFCFKKTMLAITGMIDELTAGPEYNVELAFDGTYFYTDINTRHTTGNKSFYLRISLEMDNNNGVASDLISFVQNKLILSAREQLPILITHSLPGCELNYDDSPPIQLPRSPDMVYYKIEHHCSNWQAVEEGGNIAVYLESPLPSMKIDFMAVNN